jgi:hypothetical protein
MLSRNSENRGDCENVASHIEEEMLNILHIYLMMFYKLQKL